MTFAEDHSVEWPVELNVDPHVGLLALDLKVLDLGLVSGRADGPSVFRSGSRDGPGRIVARRRRRRWWEKRSRSATRLDVIGQRDLPLVRGGRSWGVERNGGASVLHRKRSGIQGLVSMDALCV